ncbi:hypothetical protein [Parendozoicomonas haliclonae]|uniref:Uncharacterized protein n=1 Tax=Parendozoicomonas haliclonae TaxID=1960125 RepID=A0A1X7AR59_9GAMM|nr:hypothetical protein [Parendozoicomonas haliclonae]SMA49897.1 hypothetical protein EHSB41UT_03688 [Parendozoicomonas haliclonae]
MSITCETIFPEGPFKDFRAFEDCDDAIEAALNKGVLELVHKPDWYAQPPNEGGPSGYFKCVKDGSIWKISVPERTYRGYWKKLK